MNADKMKLENVKGVVEDMVEAVKEFGDLDYLVSELASMLDLDITFNSYERKVLEKAGFMIHNNKQSATKLWNKVLITVEKSDNEYFLRFGKGRYKELEDNTDDLGDITWSKSAFFSDLYNEYKEMLKDNK